MKDKIDIVHIYAGTRGAMGLYLNEIYNALNKKYSQDAIVSHYYPFEYGKKWFYRFTDISSLNILFLKNNFIRNVFKYIELFITLFKTYFFILFHKPKFINYGLTSDLFLEYIFLKVIKLTTDTKIIITCHDVVPFGSEDPNILKNKIQKKTLFFESADYLLVHNQNSKEDLKNHFNMNLNNVIFFSFPFMDLNQLPGNLNKKKPLFITESKLTVGVFGNLRKEKGVDVVLNAWNLFYKEQRNAHLIIAGYIPPGVEFDFELVENKSSTIIEKFIDDNLYKKMIESCDVVILPYKRGTNSGIPSSIISCNTLVLASNIPMFLNNNLIHSDFVFESEDPYSLASKLEWLSKLNTKDLNQFKNINKIKKQDYLKQFNLEVIDCFKFI